MNPQPKPTKRPKAPRKPLARSWMRKKAPRRVTRPGPGSDPAYLDEVRALPCRVTMPWAFDHPATQRCLGDVVAHHAGPKKNDSTAVPLCWKHHGQWHSATGVFKDWTKAHRLEWADAAIDDTRRLVAQARGSREERGRP